MYNFDCDSDSARVAFVKELAVWWNLKCLTMGKSTKVKDSESSSSIPPTLQKVGESASSSSGQSAARSPPGGSTSSTGRAQSSASGVGTPPQGDMLSVLTGISGILKDGFQSLNNKVTKVGDNIDKMEENLSNKLEDLTHDQQPQADSDMESEFSGFESNDEESGKRKRQDDHHVSEEEGEIVTSEVLQEASNALDSDDLVGGPVKEHVAAFVKKAFEKPIKGDMVKNYKEKFPTPSNIDCLDVPILNEPIYLKLSSTAKNEDRAIQANQAIFMKVVGALVKITDVLADHEKEGAWVKEAMKMGTDGITLAAALKKEWLKARRDDVKPALPEDFKSLASAKVPLSAKNLFGDDLEGSIKSVENTNKIAKKMENKKTKPPTNQKSSYKGPYKKKRKYNNNNNNKSNNNSKSDNNKGYKDKKDLQKRGSKN